MRLELIGSFRLTDQDGKEIPISGRYGPALIAILATSQRQTRSRDVLRAMLWPRSPDAQSAASLRTLLNAVRKELGPFAGHLVSDRRSVQLSGVTRTDKADGQHEFFEDAPRLGEAFEDWLSIQRSQARPDPNAIAMASETSSRFRSRICVAIYPADVTTDDPHAKHIASRIISQMRQHLCLLDMTDVLDLSILDESHNATPTVLGQRTPDVALLVSLSKVGHFAEIGIRAFEPRTKQVLWSATISADQSTTFLFSSGQLDEFVNQAVDSLNVACLRLIEAGKIGAPGAPNSIFGAVHKVLGMSVKGQSAARQFFRGKAEFENSAIATAWYAFSLANTLGEGGNRQHIMDEADSYCRRAIELDPSNALALALVAHVQSFVLRRLEVGAELARTARQIAPTLAITWDMSAMNALYRGQIDEAAQFSAKAVALGRFSPYKPLFESSQAIAASLGGNHHTAIRIAGQVLDRIPHFLAVERHLCGSLAAAGQLDQSRRLIRKIRDRDPNFTADLLDDPHYPLPSPQSVDLIRRGFSSVGHIL